MGMIDFINSVLGTSKPVETKSVPFIDPFSYDDRGALPKAYIPNFLYRPPFGYPRYINIPNIRRLAAMPYVEMCISTIIAECQAVPWDLVISKDYEFSDEEVQQKQKEIREMKNFFRNPNTNKESFEQVDAKATRDCLEIEAGVIVKMFDKEGQMREIVARDGGLFTKNPDVYGMITNRDDIIFAQMAETYDEREGKLPPGYIGANDMREKAAYFQYGWMASGRPVPFGKREIIWFEKNVRADDIYARSAVENLLKTIQMLIYAIDNNLEYFTENSIPKGIIGFPGSDDKEIEAFKQTWREQQRKLDEYGNWRKVFWNPPIINSEPKFEKIEWSAAELQLIEQQKWFSQLVWAMFGVTPSELGYTETTNNATEIVQSRVFKRKAINPLLKMKEWKYNHELLIEWREAAKKKAIATHMQETESEYVRKKIDLERVQEGQVTHVAEKKAELMEMKARYFETGEINEYAVLYLKAKEEVEELAEEGKLPYHGIEFKYLMFDVDEEKKKWDLYDLQLKSGAKTINDILKQEGENPVDWGNQPRDYTPSMNLNGPGFGAQDGNKMGTQGNKFGTNGTEQDNGQKPFGDTNKEANQDKQTNQDKRNPAFGAKSGAMEDYHFQSGNLSPEGEAEFKKKLEHYLKMGMNKEESEQNAWNDIRSLGLKSGGQKPEVYSFERFDLSNARLLSSGGSDRSAYEMPDGKILKIVKSARGLGQNQMEGVIKLVPKLYERGKDYVLVEKCEREDEMSDNMLAGMQQFTSEDWKIKTKGLLDEIDRLDKEYPDCGFKEVLNYDLIFGDFKKAKNWGWKGRPYLIDAGTLDRGELDKQFIEHLQPEWFEIVQARREARENGNTVLTKSVLLKSNLDLIEGKPGMGHSEKWWSMYEALIKEGHSKESAAKITNSKIEEKDPPYDWAHENKKTEDINHFEVQRDIFDRVAKENGVSSESLRKGFEVEKEHLKTVNYDSNIVMKIAIDHLREDPEYYEKLKKVEGEDRYPKDYGKEEKGVHLNFTPDNENMNIPKFDTLYTDEIKKKNPLILDIDEKPTEEKLIGALHFILEQNESNIVKLIEQEVRPNKVGELKSLQDIINSIKSILMLGGAKDISDAVIMQMFMQGWDKTEKQLQRNLNLNREAIDFIKKYTFENIEGMTKELIEDLRQELERGMIEGEGAFKLTERVKQVFSSSKTRAEAIARTETNRAENQGRLLAFKESGEEYEKKWISHIDERTSDICKRLNGKTVGLNETFKDAQTGFEGMAPPGHVNCRSQVVFVPKER